MTDRRAKSCASIKPVRVRVYIDGLNFHFNVATRFGVKQINVASLIEKIISTDLGVPVEIENATLFTSLLLDEAERVNQDKYYKVLTGSCGNIKVEPGLFQKTHKKCTLVKEGRKAKVEVFEEKESDVRLGCAVINDACKEHGIKFDVACLVSDDRDMKPVFDIMIAQGKRILWLSPKRIVIPDAKNIYRANKFLTKELPSDIQITTAITRDMVLNNQLPEGVMTELHPDAEGWSIALR